jgi:DNA anti-recombination protein RmuC
MLDLHKASMGAAFDSHQVVVADATQQSVQIFDARLAALAEAADQSTRIIDLRLADMVDAANRNAETIDERLVARIQAMSEVLTRAASEAESIWAARGASVANALRAKVDDLRDVIEGKGADLVAALGARGDDVSARIVGVGERAMQSLDQQMAGLASLLTRRTDELIAAVNGSAADPVRALSALTGQLRSEVADSSEALRSVAADATQRSAETIEALLKRLTDQVEASGASLRETVTRSAESSVESLSGTSDRLRSELMSAIDNLGQTSAVIDRAIGSAGDRLGAVQSGLAARVEEFQQALGGIASQVAALGRLSATTQSDAGTLAAQLAQHAEALGAVGRDLAQQQQSLDYALEHRRSSLEALIGDISGRSEAFDATLGRFAANVEDSFARSQARAQEISAALASATRGASIAVAGQFETIRDTATKERERTVQTLQATLEQTNSQLTGALDHAADRFRQSVAEVKDMASQVQRELDQTRQELRRGVLDLPQETSETADAMRRVVSDQIKALKELAALVSDSGGAYDVVEPGAPVAATTAVTATRFEKPVLRAVERTLEVEVPSQSEAFMRVADAVVERATENLALGRITPTELSPPFAPTQTQAWPTSPAPAQRSVGAPASAADRGQPGWLSNLLAAASRDEPEETPSKGAETLEALNREIAGLIDNAAAVEMWDRWRRGDTGAVSRRLYTEAGQQAFDELRRRFRADPQFRETTTRYMQEFERLLSKIGQNDRDGAQWRAYLLSNTGKVYTILAHASGKLG